MAYQSGRHFLQIPGPTNVPDRVLRAIAAPTIDHRGPEFAALARHVLAGLGRLCGSAGPVAVYPSSGTGAWEAALVNTLSPGDRVLAFDTGHFATLWSQMAVKLGLDVDLVPGDWRQGVQAAQVHEKLAADRGHRIRAVTVVQNETSTGCASQIPLIRAALDRAGHPALLLVDTISSLGSVDYRHDEWGVDVTIWCSQKGMMLPPGLGLNAISAKALAVAERARLPRSYWDWRPVLAAAQTGLFPYTPSSPAPGRSTLITSAARLRRGDRAAGGRPPAVRTRPRRGGHAPRREDGGRHRAAALVRRPAGQRRLGLDLGGCRAQAGHDGHLGLDLRP
jgi:alanine-glyoxylate transaminase / serine-glyoxylate transaminase / serine-pyruvate transaminase